MKKQNLFDVCNIAKRKLRQKMKRKQKKIQKILQQLFQNIIDRDVVRNQKIYEFLHFLKQIQFEISKICTIVNFTHIEIFAKFVVSKSTH